MASLPHIPLLYRIMFLYFEPFSAFNGALLCHFRPANFLTTMSATATYSPSVQVIFDQVAACYILFAFNEAVVLRITKELRVWKTMILGMVLCDMLHIYGSWQALGTEVSLRPWLWRSEDALNMTILYGFLLLRLAFLAGIGLGKGVSEKKQA
ncbi:hypothetical protein BU24DRAFT_423611 [Aaosphaeria arxii CBS 175.79]|uniref:DUF7704 domain-containing protein n=1 Tax=Aaosphaeria arxii CBS 175.79 TaxID=1450172 RepID=A0A6A5XNJ7_9PLEO|nr:uncharacterized protein BU24DRAFT_423611 [Aaosphaeria arxii CBS 175.79]KAF2014712.1 hypothetical protein BU24DRAFT_423611 [Aaosphaeria arxii CBS 175.79]